MKKSSLIWIVGLLIFGAWWYFQRGPGLPVPGPYVTSGSELASLDTLLGQGQREDKPVVLLFTGSDWCPPCKLMARQIFEQVEWQTFAREAIIFVVYDFPRSGGGPGAEQREAMAQRFGVRGLPHLVVLNAEGGKAAERSGFRGGTVADYKAWIFEAIEI